MPGWNLVIARNCISEYTNTGILAALFAVLFFASSGCSKLAQGTLQELVNDNPSSWHSDESSQDDYYVAPDAQDELDSLNRSSDQTENTTRAKFVLPKVELPIEPVVVEPAVAEQIKPVEVAAAKIGPVDATPRDQNIVAQQLVPAAQVLGQPLRPLTFDSKSRKIIEDQVVSLRQDNVIKLNAQPSAQKPNQPMPMVAGIESPPSTTGKFATPPPLRSLGVADPNNLSDPNAIVQSPTPLSADFDLEWAANHKLGEESLLDVVEPFADAVDAQKQYEQTGLPPFAALPMPDSPTSDQLTGKTGVTEQPNCDDPECEHKNDFEVPENQAPIDLVVESEGVDHQDTAAVEEPVQRIDAHDSMEVDLDVVGIAESIAVDSSSVEVTGASLATTGNANPDLTAAATPDPVKSFRLVNPHFCTSVSGYGQFDSFETNRFGPNQHLLAYCEIENFTSLEDNTGSELVYRTRLRGSYKIFDAEGNTVDMYEFPVVEDTARNRRRDFYVHLPVHLAELPVGSYTFQLNIDDLNGDASSNLEQALEFEVIE